MIGVVSMVTNDQIICESLPSKNNNKVSYDRNAMMSLFLNKKCAITVKSKRVFGALHSSEDQMHAECSHFNANRPSLYARWVIMVVCDAAPLLGGTGLIAVTRMLLFLF